MADLVITDESEWKTLTDSLAIIRYWLNFVNEHADIDEEKMKAFMQITTDKIIKTTGIKCETALNWIDVWTKEDNFASVLLHIIADRESKSEDSTFNFLRNSIAKRFEKRRNLVSNKKSKKKTLKLKRSKNRSFHHKQNNIKTALRNGILQNIKAALLNKTKHMRIALCNSLLRNTGAALHCRKLEIKIRRKHKN